MKEIILNPVRIRIIQLLAYRQSITVAELAAEMPDIPRSSIYRHVSLLSEHGVLQITKEQKIRGTYEREYALNTAYLNKPDQNPGETVSAFLLKLVSDFSRYFQSPQADPERDQLFLSINTLLLRDDEFLELKEKLFQVVKDYMNFAPEEGRKVHNLSLLSSPADSINDKEASE